MEEVHSLAEEGYDGGRTGIAQTTSSCSGTAVVDHGRNVLKEPLVRAVAQPENVFGRGLISAEFAPASRDDGATADPPNRLDQSGRKLGWIVDHYTPEADVNRWRPLGKKSCELRVRLVAWRVAEKEAADI